MHELGVVFHIIDAIIDVCKENQAKHISSCTLSVGEVSMIVPKYFEDCWKWAVEKHEETKGCELKIEIIKGVTYCEDCQGTYETVKYGKTCPYCKSERTYLLHGNEVEIKEIAVDQYS